MKPSFPARALLLVAAPIVGALIARFDEPVQDSLLRSTAPPLLVRPWAPRAPDPSPQRAVDSADAGTFAWIPLPSEQQAADAVARELTGGERPLAAVAVRCQVTSRSACELSPDAIAPCVQAGPDLAELPRCTAESTTGITLIALFQETAVVTPRRLAEDCLREACEALQWSQEDGE